VILSPGESGIYDLFDISPLGVTTEFANPLAIVPDSAAEDCLTGIALASNESSNVLYIADLTQAIFSSGSWTAPGTAQTSVTIPEFPTTSAPNISGITGMAVAPGSHLAIIAGENGGNAIGVLRLTPGGSESVNCLPVPFTFPSGACAIADYAVASLPNWQQGAGPHGVTAYKSPNDGQFYALLANASPPTSVAVIDLQALITAPRTNPINNPLGPHTVDPNFVNNAVRFVVTGN
jgi:hypothetical protein